MNKFVVCMLLALGCGGNNPEPKSDDATKYGDPACVPNYSFTNQSTVVKQYCKDFVDTLCRRLFECDPSYSSYATVDDCMVEQEYYCDEIDMTWYMLDTKDAGLCLDYSTNLSCETLAATTIYPCETAVIVRPPNPSSCVPIGVGKVLGAIDKNDQDYFNGKIDTYCTCLSTGDNLNLKITKTALASGNLGGAVLIVFDPHGYNLDVQISVSLGGPDSSDFDTLVKVENLDVAEDGQYMIVVLSEEMYFGGYELDVRID